MNLLESLLLLASELDQGGHYKLASQVDGLIKQALETSEDLIRNRFWSKVNKTDDCWNWTGAKDSGGYGVCTVNGKNHNTHRLSWEWANRKKVPQGQVLLHSCDTASCVNPSHLTPGSQKNNVEDRVNKDRSAKGKRNGRARLTDKDIKKIKKLRAKGLTETAIAVLFGVGRSTISNVLHNRTWNWME